MRILSVRRRVLLFAAADGDGGDGADGDGADRGGAGGRPEEAGHRHLPRPRTQLPLQLLGERPLQRVSEDSSRENPSRDENIVCTGPWWSRTWLGSVDLNFGISPIRWAATAQEDGGTFQI